MGDGRLRSLVALVALLTPYSPALKVRKQGDSVLEAVSDLFMRSPP